MAAAFSQDGGRGRTRRPVAREGSSTEDNAEGSSDDGRGHRSGDVGTGEEARREEDRHQEEERRVLARSGKDHLELLRRNDLELGKGAVLRALVGAPPPKLC